MLKVHKVSKSYKLVKKSNKRILDILLKRNIYKENNVFALNNITFELEQGNSLGIIGRNGSGKSTLLQIISKTLLPTNGYVETSVEMTSILELGAGFNHNLTGLENIKITLGIWNFNSRDKNVLIKEIIEFSGLKKFINQSLNCYSSGMIVRLGFSLCTVVKPKILVIDEALSVGDQVFQAKCIRRIKELQAQGTSLILVSHSSELIKSMCNTVLVLEEGNMKFQGDAREGINYYEKVILSDFVKKEKLILHNDKHGKEIESKKAELVSCKILNNESKQIKTLTEGNTINIEICIKHNTQMDDPHYGIRILNSNGEIVFGTTTYSNQVFAKKQKRGDKVFLLFKIENFFRKDNYSISVGCTNLGIGFPNIAWKEFIFLEHEVCTFTITSSNKGRWEGHSLLNTQIIINN